MFDSDQEFFDCPFCGNRFDIIDFHADEVLDQARSCLKSSSFAAAKEKFDQVLDNDPQNFDALLGNVLCTLKLTSPEQIENIEVFSDCDLNKAKIELINAARISVKSKAEYFNRFIEFIESYEKAVKLEKEKKELLSGENKKQINEKMLSDLREFRSDERWKLPWVWIILGGCMLLSIVSSLAASTGSLMAIILTWVGFFSVVGLIFHFVRRADRLHDSDYKPANIYEKEFKSEIEGCWKDCMRAFEEMKELYARITKDSQEEAEAVKSAPPSDPELDPEIKISCAKCGAGLVLDKNKRVYECDHCGVAYGVSLFFGLPMEKALNSLNTGNYKDAGQRFSNLLMTDPSGFEPLLGKILCAGKWTKVSDIRLSAGIVDKDLIDVTSALNEAKQHAADADLRFFEKLEEMISFFEPYSSNKEILRDNSNAVSEMETRADIRAMAVAGANYDENYKKERRDLVSRSYPLQVRQKKLEVDFASIRKELIESRHGCRLVS